MVFPATCEDFNTIFYKPSQDEFISHNNMLSFILKYYYISNFNDNLETIDFRKMLYA